MPLNAVQDLTQSPASPAIPGPPVTFTCRIQELNGTSHGTIAWMLNPANNVAFVENGVPMKVIVRHNVQFLPQGTPFILQTHLIWTDANPQPQTVLVSALANATNGDQCATSCMIVLHPPALFAAVAPGP